MATRNEHYGLFTSTPRGITNLPHKNKTPSDKANGVGVIALARDTIEKP